MRLLVLLAMLAACGDNNIPQIPKLKITAGTSLVTSESGGTATFTVGFDIPPRLTTPVTLSSSNTHEGRVTPAAIELTPESFDGALVTVTGVDDDEIDGNQLYQIQIDAGVLGADEVDVINDDDDGQVGGAAVSPITTMTTEAGGTAAFMVMLTAKPSQNVTIPLSSSNPAEGTLSTSQITFDPTNWDTPQTIIVTGVDDDLDDGDKQYMAVLGPATSNDPAYSGLNPDDVMLTNVDDDTHGVTISAITPANTTEAGGPATFTIVLTSQPTSDVTIALSSDDTSEGDVSPGSVTFTSANWDQPRTITVSGNDDVIDDGDITYHVVTAPATSGDPQYNGFDAADVTVVNTDDDGAGFTIVSPVGGLVTSEGGQSDSFTIALASQPTADVTIPIASNDASEGITLVGSVTFTSTDWNMPRQVFVLGQDDTTADGDMPYTIVLGAATSTDANYSGQDPADLAAKNLDNDNAQISVFPTDGLFISELGDTDSFDIVLLSQPSANVTIPLASNDTTEGTLFPSNVTDVTFTPANWNVPQTVTVKGVDDALADGNITFSIVTGPAQSSDMAFNNVDAADVTVTNFDNETANVFVQARKTLQTNETGGPSGQATFRVRLTTTPTAPVTCTLSSSDLTEGQVSPQTLVFNNTGFQTVTISGIDDAIVDGDVQYFIITAPCTSTDPDYDQRNPRDVGVINRDNDP